MNEIDKIYRISNNDWELLDIDTATFIFNEGEKCLGILNNVSSKISERSYTLLNILITVCPLLIGVSYQFGMSFFIILLERKRS